MWVVCSSCVGSLVHTENVCDAGPWCWIIYSLSVYPTVSTKANGKSLEDFEAIKEVKVSEVNIIISLVFVHKVYYAAVNLEVRTYNSQTTIVLPLAFNLHKLKIQE